MDECKPLPLRYRVSVTSRHLLAWRNRTYAKQGLTLVPNPAQLELTLPLAAQIKLTVSPVQANVTRGCVPKVLKLSSIVSDVSRRPSS